MQRFGTFGVLTIAILAGSVIGAWAQANGGPSGPSMPPSMGGYWDGALGGGGMGLAGLMFYFYRQDRKASEDSLTKIASEFREIVEGNTRAITALKTVIESVDNE